MLLCLRYYSLPVLTAFYQPVTQRWFTTAAMRCLKREGWKAYSSLCLAEMGPRVQKVGQRHCLVSVCTEAAVCVGMQKKAAKWTNLEKM